MEISNKIIVAVLSATLYLVNIPSAFSHSDENATETHTTRTLSMDDVRAKYADSNSKFVDLDGINVHYKDEGKGPVILLVHGTLGDLFDWDVWTQELLKSGFRVVRFDIPGFGLSGNIANGNYSVDRTHTLIDSLMDHVGAEKFGIAGISYGGMVVFRYAATRTDRVTSMVLINSAGIQTANAVKRKPKTPGEKPKRTSIFMYSPVVEKDDIVSFYDNYINDKSKVTPEFVQRKLDFLNIQERDKTSIATFKLYEKGDPQRVLSHVKAPSLIMWGTANKALDTKTASAFIDALPNACLTKLVTFESGGHYINIERPIETVKVAQSFFLDLKSAKLCK
ncbi:MULTISPECIES: alpha/beta fold hydrolase [Alteromonadaceae]|uniref:alpha/beta fold hydrolase n=1 Tax=Alteromonadaceae TaxID=72275 RepID=UPI001C0825D9|nr:MULTISPECIES: alpha/beta hydrolase [Aliiglaciecola]MBU2879023.1 alpha/beta hydrolase [Aliiglaciecola lipolytica]MDO6710721.1 alpha/beta hydrolase [Aliiglaciecola sp. 2_MG-2023]MDO6751871.1 alpha/beta hydrolase [Aliiglaciecola sp. 1_MG-2023]